MSEQYDLIYEATEYDYLVPLDPANADIFLKDIYMRNCRRLRSNFLRELFAALRRGTQNENIFLVKCSSSQFKSSIKNVVSNVLMPFAGFDAVKGMIKSLLAEHNAMHIMGFFNPDLNKLYVTVENPMFGDDIKALDDDTFDIIIHEMCHYMAANDPKLFYQLYYELYLYPFYFKLFKKLKYYTSASDINMTIIDSDIDKIVNIFLTRMLKSERVISKKSVSKKHVGIYLQETYDEIAKIDNDIAVFWSALLQDAIGLREYIRTTLHLIDSVYKDMGIKLSNRFLFYQELIFPSEVIAIISSANKKQTEYLELLRSF